ncbi:hypothetical protein [Embleya scabrispora]|uniref:hypothetical protein n=1 Tax=Embleya scabrispora TaxID=159449 RepID=UPI00131A10FD|nr:hypothetical protein [Embleya scabrispora]MYS81911.1 hypothetical protein [Streptomyces sp. SID5474]
MVNAKDTYVRRSGGAFPGVHSVPSSSVLASAPDSATIASTAGSVDASNPLTLPGPPPLPGFQGGQPLAPSLFEPRTQEVRPRSNTGTSPTTSRETTVVDLGAALARRQPPDQRDVLGRQLLPLLSVLGLLPLLQLLDGMDRLVTFDGGMVYSTQQEEVLETVDVPLVEGIMAEATRPLRTNMRNLHNRCQMTALPQNQGVPTAGIRARLRAAEQQLDRQLGVTTPP